ncbi:MAG: toll/interleukin-1 receptor domain-containing protein [Candidatus Magnetomorum sp.]|nr:toll/interleukin-1 receptor domain-containing protein [Candidatus Magnetomorum sp.]
MSQQYKKVFISYSHEDSEFVEKLYHQLQQDGVTCFFDKDSIRWGEHWPHALEKGLEKSDIVIPVLSPNYLKSEWTKLEYLFYCSDDPLSKKRPIRPLMYQGCQASGFLKNIQHIDVQTPQLFEKNYPSILKELSLEKPLKELSLEKPLIEKSPQWDKYLYCNRDPQVDMFNGQFESLYTSNPGSPQFYVVHGHAYQYHELLVERLKLETKIFLSSNGCRHRVSLPVMQIALPHIGSSEDRIELFKNNLYQKLREKRYLQNVPPKTAQSMSSACRHMTFSQNETLFFRFIVQGNWNKHHLSLINWIVSDYFSKDDFKHQFVVFFEITYSSLFFQILSGYPKWIIRRSLQKKLIAESCTLLHELRSFSRPDINTWLINHLDQNPMDIYNDCEIQRFLFCKRFLCMKEAKKLLQVIEKKYYEKKQMDFL